MSSTQRITSQGPLHLAITLVALGAVTGCHKKDSGS